MQTLFESLLKSALDDNGYTFSAEIIQQFSVYLNLLQKWNHVFNLTAIDQPKEMVYLHMIDSLSAAPYLRGQRMLDIGSGAGLPGIPLAIIHPEQEWTLLDKSNKKIHFMTQAVAELGLKNIHLVAQRSEDFHPSQCFDSIISRAFASLRLMLEVSAHLACPKGIFIAMKGQYPQNELAEIPEEFAVQGVHRVAIKGWQVERHIVCIEKKEPT